MIKFFLKYPLKIVTFHMQCLRCPYNLQIKNTLYRINVPINLTTMLIAQRTYSLPKLFNLKMKNNI